MDSNQTTGNSSAENPACLKNEDEVREYYFRTVNPVTVPARNSGWIPFRPRWLNWIYAMLNGYFWLPCECGKYFGGHEWYGSHEDHGVCPTCTMETFNLTGKLNKGGY